MRKKLFNTLIILTFWIIGIIFFAPIGFAASPKLSVSYEPSNPNFTTGQQNVVTAILTSSSGNISAAAVSFEATGGLRIVNVLDALDESNKPLTNTKYVDETISEKGAKTTILVMKATADLPTGIKIPVVVSGKTGNLQIDTKESHIIDQNGVNYTLSQPKPGYIIFSENGKDTVPPPSPTPVPANTVSLNLAMKFQGIKPSEVKTKSMSGVKVQLVSGSLFSIPQFITVTMDEGGLWKGTAVIPNVRPGNTYILLIKGPKHLQKRICENNASEQKIGSYRCSDGKIQIQAGSNTINTSDVALMTGDLGIQDGILNGYDLSFIQNTIKKTAKNLASDADVNYDGVVNKTDYDLVVESLLTTGGQDQQ